MRPVAVLPDHLTEVEWNLVRRLREVPEGAARDQLLLLIDDLVAFVADPRCARAQGDGVPCASLDTACEQCQSVAQTLARVLGRVHQAY